ncbi:hypothetical protein EDD34_2464 [Myceligenerans xiligouense]|uniref:Uncharacterized protein n=1 Tax=Myceligenerans xiligouense TaxID=253184 RepID=A0A3N4Z7K2_9MICO|nr:hypothetical protein EDD34_2464 [Myceligenerans xiligouense]
MGLLDGIIAAIINVLEGLGLPISLPPLPF